MGNNNINVLWAGRPKYLPNWGIRSHRHGCYQIFYIVAGNCQFTVNGQVFDAEQNQYVLVLSNEDHSMQKDHDNMVRMIDIKFELPDAALANNMAFIKKTDQAPEQISYLFKLISNELKNPDSNNKEIIESYLYVILLKMMPSTGEEGALIITGINESLWTPICKDIAKYVKENYASNVVLEDIADHLGYNKNYICGIFKRGTSLTIMDYLKMVRIERACELIELSDYTFQQISLMAGFSDIHNFNKVFKQTIKMTPGQYKAKFSERDAIKQDTFKNEDNYDVQ